MEKTRTQSKDNSLQRNFTLIELLVVIAIIAILAAMLLPVLKSSRARGHSASCIANLKQQSTAVISYSNDFEYLPAMVLPTPTLPDNDWGGMMMPGYMKEFGYLGSNLGVWTCAAAPNPPEYEIGSDADKQGESANYAYNKLFCITIKKAGGAGGSAPLPSKHAQIAQFRNSSKLAMLADHQSPPSSNGKFKVGARFSYFLGAPWKENPSNGTTLFVDKPDATSAIGIVLRHTKKANIATFSGSVVTLDANEILEKNNKVYTYFSPTYSNANKLYESI